jgi:hypothetical protein
MKLNAGLHLAYCTNVHRGRSWAEAFQSLKDYTLAVRDRVSPGRPFGISLCLENHAVRQLNERSALLELQRWLASNQCYLLSMDGFSYGHFQGPRIKEQVYEPDWSSPERVEYTKVLADLLSQLLPAGIDGSVSILPGSFKGFHPHSDELKQMRNNLWRCVEHVARVSEQTGRRVRLGIDPEPMCLVESSGEIIQFFERMRSEHPRDPRLAEHLGVSYDTCHFAVEFEEPQNALSCLLYHGIKITKIHASSALKLLPTAQAREGLAALAADPYLHQVVVRRSDGQRFIHSDLRPALSAEEQEPDEALAIEPAAPGGAGAQPPEWRVHFHVPLHCPPASPFDTTADHVQGTLDLVAASPEMCPLLEMKSCVWDFLPSESKAGDVVDQLVAEYGWLLGQLGERGLVMVPRQPVQADKP